MPDHTADRFPTRITVTNETGQPWATIIRDAATGEEVRGIFVVSVSRDGFTLEGTIHWPLTNDDHTVNDPTWQGRHLCGLKTMLRQYTIKSLQIEAFTEPEENQ